MKEFYSIITNRGLEKQVELLTLGKSISLTHMAFGDCNGNSQYKPDGSETKLKSEVYRTTITRVVVDSVNRKTMIIEAVINAKIGPFWIREVGVFDSDGELFAIGKFPETYKPILESGAIKDLTVKIILTFANTPNIELVYNSGLGGVNTSLAGFITYTDYGFIKENHPFETENRPKFEYDFAVGDFSYDYGNLK